MKSVSKKTFFRVVLQLMCLIAIGTTVCSAARFEEVSTGAVSIAVTEYTDVYSMSSHSQSGLITSRGYHITDQKLGPASARAEGSLTTDVAGNYIKIDASGKAEALSNGYPISSVAAYQAQFKAIEPFYLLAYVSASSNQAPLNASTSFMATLWYSPYPFGTIPEQHLLESSRFISLNHLQAETDTLYQPGYYSLQGLALTTFEPGNTGSVYNEFHTYLEARSYPFTERYIIIDDFSDTGATEPWGEQPDITNLPGGTRAPKGTGSSSEGTKQRGGVRLKDRGSAISISSFSVYRKPTKFTIGIELGLETAWTPPTGPVDNLLGLGLGFYPNGDPTVSVTEGFTGLVMNPLTGALTLIIDGTDSGQTMPYPGSFSSEAQHYLAYTVDTVAGGLENVRLDDYLLFFETTAFTDAHTSWAAFYSNLGGDSIGLENAANAAFNANSATGFAGLFDRFSVVSVEVPEPASMGTLAIGFLAVLNRRNRKWGGGWH